MTKKQFLALRPGDHVRWVGEGDTEQGQEGVVKQQDTHCTIHWYDGERLPCTDMFAAVSAKYIKKIRD